MSPMSSFAQRLEKELDANPRHPSTSDERNQGKVQDAGLRSSVKNTGSLSSLDSGLSKSGPLSSPTGGSLLLSSTGSLLSSIMEGIVSSVDDGKESVEQQNSPPEEERKLESSGEANSLTKGKLRATLRPKLAAITSLLRPKTATTRGSLTATPRGSDTPRGGDTPRATNSRPPAPPAKTSGPQTPPEGLQTQNPYPSQTARALRSGSKPKSDGTKPRVTLEVNLLGAETPGRGAREGDAAACGTRRRPASAHPLLQAATTQLQMLKPEQLEVGTSCVAMSSYLESFEEGQLPGLATSVPGCNHNGDALKIGRTA